MHVKNFVSSVKEKRKRHAERFSKYVELNFQPFHSLFVLYIYIYLKDIIEVLNIL